MRREMEFIIRRSILSELHKRTRAHIVITFKGDDMQVDLMYHNEKFTYYEYNMIEKICYGLNSKQVADNVVRAYKKHILSKYFL